MLESKIACRQVLTIRNSDGLEMTYEISAVTETSQDGGKFNPALNNNLDAAIIKPLAEAFGALVNAADAV